VQKDDLMTDMRESPRHQGERISSGSDEALLARVWLDYYEPTPHALIAFKFTSIEVNARPSSERGVEEREAPTDEKATSSANIEINYRDARGRFSVPSKQTGHLLDFLTCALSVGGIYSICTSILGSSVGSSPMRVALCVLCVAAIVWLATVSIHRNRA
jgi:hypothetical protein